MYKHCALTLMTGLGIALAAPANSEPTPLRDATRATMKAGFAAMDKKDFKTALSHFEKAQAVVDAVGDPGTSFDGHMTRTAIAFVTGKVRADGKLGDPCPSFAKARTYAAALSTVAQGAATDDEQSIIGDITKDLDDNEVKHSCRNAKASLANEGLVGHYTLSGVMEVGSELRLSADGRYEWYMSYGSVDQFSTGTWTVGGQSVILTHAKTPAGTPLFTPKKIEPWDVDTENRVLRGAREAQVEAIFKACPFLGEGDVSNTAFAPPAMAVTIPSQVPAPKLDHDAALKTAQLAERQARANYERAAARAMGKGSDWDVAQGDARMARHEWEEASRALIVAVRAVEREIAGAPEPILPKMCEAPPEPFAEDIPEEKWVKGFAVIVGDPSVGMRFQNVDVIFHFADGTHAASKTVRGGLAWTAKRAGNAVTAVSLNYRGAGRDDAKPERFAIGPASDGVLPVEMQSRQFTDPPFDEMRLAVTDADTLSGPQGRGQYTRR